MDQLLPELYVTPIALASGTILVLSIVIIRLFSNGSSVFSILNNKEMTIAPTRVSENMQHLETLFDGKAADGVHVSDAGRVTSKDSIEKRQKEYATMVDSFYNLVTDFYQYGWGASFHFAPRFRDETFMESLKRAEYYLAKRLGDHAGVGKKVLDVGCGIGGPLCNIARHSGASVTGVTINAYQVKVANRRIKAMGLHKPQDCSVVQGDFMKLSDKFGQGVFDAAYEIEATCHAPDRVGCFTEVAKVLKPGGLFTGYEWVVTNSYNPKNPSHVKLKEGIEVGNGLPTLARADDVKRALEEAGFEVLQAGDANENANSPHEVPWYKTLEGSYTLQGFRMTPTGRACTTAMVTLLEFFGIAPKGSIKVSQMLSRTADDLVTAGQQQLFTPSYFFLARKK